MSYFRRSCKFLTTFKTLNERSFLVRPNVLLRYQCQTRNYMVNGSRSMANMGRILVYSFVGVTGLSIAGTLYIKYGRNAEIKANSGEIPSQIIPTKHVSYVSGTNTNGLKLTLFQYQTCPFCCKVRAFLDYYGISYDVVEVNPVLRNQIKFSPSKKVPILIVQDKDKAQQVNDSSVIISALHSYFLDSSQAINDIIESFPLVSYTNEDGKEMSEIANRYFLMYNEKPYQRSDEELKRERKWRQWVDSVLVHMLSPNVYREPTEALQAFQWFSEVGDWEKNFPAWERLLVIYVGAAAMYLVGKRLKKRHGLKDDVRESLYDACKEWQRAVGRELFHGGKGPNLADLAVYGVLNAIEGCDAFKDMQANTDIGPWYERMRQLVLTNSGSQAQFR